ncbi:MAG: carboxypeptidase regulatory-like domain-containing protein [Saprospiraceae bacterium]|nr:carboxypeptidase regulatory-like domain-containing protein [Saprospiraceae bacterium]
MKITLFLSAFWLAFAGIFFPNDKVTLKGKVTGASGEALIGVHVVLSKERTTVAATTTDVNGNYKLEVEPGTYDLEVSYTGFVTKRMLEVEISKEQENMLDFTLEENGAALSEVVVMGYSKRKSHKKDVGFKAPPAAMSKTEDRLRTEPAVYKPDAGEAKPMPSAPITPAPDDDIIIVDGRKKRVVVPFDPETYEEKVVLIDVEDEAATGEPSTREPADELVESIAPGTIPQPKPRAGLLTAGEWSDLNNWNKHWVDLLADGEINPHQELYGFFPQHRFTLLLTNNLDVPLPDVPVQLKSGGELVWEARTDNTGKAELWAGLFDKKEKTNLTVEAWVNGKKFEVKNPKAAKNGFNFLKVEAECYAPKNVDIVWAVDATGSMGDELEYLKTELLDVIGRAQHKNPALNFKMGTSFYRDKGDEYIVKSSGLSPDIHKTVEFIQKQYAGGGGDYPEAVHSALEDVVYGQTWSENAIARICFLVLDASPHNEPEVKASLQKTIREAAKKGIRIVPLAASGIQKDTEFLMKFFGLATNGTYLFLTDHSGIGGKHLEPTTDEYKVEALNDLLVRIITEYTSIETCEGKSNIRFEGDPQQQPGQVFQASYYPNPAVDQFTLELPFEVQSVTLYDSEGKGVRKIEKLQSGPNVIQINDLAAGFYTIRINNNGTMQTGKLLVVRS